MILETSEITIMEELEIKRQDCYKREGSYYIVNNYLVKISEYKGNYKDVYGIIVFESIKKSVYKSILNKNL